MPITFCLFLLHVDTYQNSASCCEPTPFHFNLLFLWVNARMNTHPTAIKSCVLVNAHPSVSLGGASISIHYYSRVVTYPYSYCCSCRTVAIPIRLLLHANTVCGSMPTQVQNRDCCRVYMKNHCNAIETLHPKWPYPLSRSTNRTSYSFYFEPQTPATNRTS